MKTTNRGAVFDEKYHGSTDEIVCLNNKQS